MEIQANIAGKGLAQIEIERDQINSVSIFGPADPEKPFVCPGFVDIQLNGFGGVDFSDQNLEPEQAISVLPSVWKAGVTTFCPTLITNSHQALARNFHVLEKAREIDPRFAWAVPCYHLEGPYLPPGEARGAHNAKFMRPPSWGEFAQLQRAAGNRIGIVTLAPELPGALDFIQKAHNSGVIVGLGHTEATPEQIHAAAECGAALSTHLGNGCPQLIDRHRAPFWAQLADDRLQASMICDGFHLPPELVQVIFRVKGIHRCILITDAVFVAGLAPGRYTLVGLEIELRPDGRVGSPGGPYMAGSALSMNRAVSRFMQLGGVSLAEAIQAATTNPAHLLGRGRIADSMAKDQPANLVLFRLGADELRVEALILGGHAVYRSDTCL